MQRTDAGSEVVHRVRGSVEVALDVIDRSVTMYMGHATPCEERVLEELRLAARALAAAGSVLDEQLCQKIGAA